MNSKGKTANRGNFDSLLTWLLEKFGPLMTTGEVAGLFGISYESLCNTLRVSHDPNVEKLRDGKVRFGRRVRYRTDVVADALLDSQRS